jgi:glycosyltransferase involved in cell wall biosynthesis
MCKHISHFTKVSIVTPSYNQGEFLEQTICSVLGQNYDYLEYFIIDGGSSDNTLDIIKKYKDKLDHWESRPDKGQAHAINKGITRSNGDILGWLNSDDVLLPGTVNHVISIFTKHPEVDVVYGSLERINQKGKIIPTPSYANNKTVFNKKLVIGDCIVNQPGSFWRRRVMEKAGMLNENLEFSLDYEYWIRLALAGAIFYRVPDPLAQFRISNSSKTVKKSEKMALEQLSVLEGYLSNPNLSNKIGISKKQLDYQARKTRSVIGLYAFYGYMKIGLRKEAAHWISFSLRQYPLVIFQRRWLDLINSKIKRIIKNQ